MGLNCGRTTLGCSLCAVFGMTRFDLLASHINVKLTDSLPKVRPVPHSPSARIDRLRRKTKSSPLRVAEVGLPQSDRTGNTIIKISNILEKFKPAIYVVNYVAVMSSANPSTQRGAMSSSYVYIMNKWHSDFDGMAQSTRRPMNVE